jgi:hypothetical protein
MAIKTRTAARKPIHHHDGSLLDAGERVATLYRTAALGGFDALRRRSTLAVLMLVASGCTVPKPPGVLVGAYHIEGTLRENSCGHAALPAVDEFAFDVEVRKDEKGRGIWVGKEPPPHYGRLDENGEFSFELENSYALDTSSAQPFEGLGDVDPALFADPELYERLDQQGTQRCTLIVAQSMNGTLLRDNAGSDSTKDASVQDSADLVGENAIVMHAAPGSHCQPVLTTYGGPFDELPCKARYELSGELATN